MKNGQKSLTRLLLGILLLSLPFSSKAQSYPNKTVRVLVGIAPGGGTDTIARLLMQKLTNAYGISFLIDNRPSAGGNIATEIVARAPKDGYTLIFVSPTFAVNPSLWKNIGYDPVKDFSPVIQVASFQYVLTTNTSLPVSNIKDLTTVARIRRLSYGSTGNGSANHLAGELFKNMAGIDLTHIPYKGSAPALNALLSGEIQLMFSSSGGVMPHVSSGRIRAIAVTGLQRSSLVPGIPTISESGLTGFDVTGWYGLLAPAGVPTRTIESLNSYSNRYLPELKDAYGTLGTDIAGGTSSEFAIMIKRELGKWSKVVKLSQASLE